LRRPRYCLPTVTFALADADLVFCARTGTPLLPSNVVRSFKRLLGCAGLRPTIRLYDLRHANATAMLAAGVHPKVASERLGHAGVTLFMDTYSHLLPELEAGAATALQDVFGRARRGVRGLTPSSPAARPGAAPARGPTTRAGLRDGRHDGRSAGLKPRWAARWAARRETPPPAVFRRGCFLSGRRTVGPAGFGPATDSL